MTDDHVWYPYVQLATMADPFEVVHTEGTKLHLADGRVLVDGISSWWTAAHGYNPPYILDAVRRQLSVMPHVMLGGLTHRPAQTLAARLCEAAGPDFARVFFAESGSVAVEVALKMCLQSHLDAGRPGPPKMVCFFGGYHGDTLGTMAVCDPEEGMHHRFADLLMPHHVRRVPRTDEEMAAFESWCAAQDDIAGIIIEPLVQCAGGMHAHPEETLRCLRRAADAAGVPLVFDEIAVGLFRTGRRFAFEHAGVTPDILVLGKGLTGGVCPLSATLAQRHIVERFASSDASRALMHGPTFTGHALGCAAALAALDLFDAPDLPGRVAAIERRLHAALAPLEALPHVARVIVRGAIGAVGLTFVPDRDAFVAACAARGAYIRPILDVVYLMPALTVPPSDLELLCRVVSEEVSDLCPPPPPPPA